MAGSFGYEAEHYEVSMAVGRDRLFPAIEAEDADTSDMFTEVSRGIDQWLWFVEAHLQADN